ncbi:MAG TPA: hypothetical protein VLZ50_08255 [Terracidiphilus sp.]|nr:hypothetical protein [Terracidiphilus sp.]
MKHEENKGGEAETDAGAPPSMESGSASAPDRPHSHAREGVALTILQLPALAAISLYMLILGGVAAVGVVGHHYPPLFLVLAVAFFTASFGLMRMMRWAWALTLSAVVLLAAYCFWIFSAQHQGSALVQGLLNLVFFLYLVRVEVREKLR